MDETGIAFGLGMSNRMSNLSLLLRALLLCCWGISNLSLPLLPLSVEFLQVWKRNQKEDVRVQD